MRASSTGGAARTSRATPDAVWKAIQPKEEILHLIRVRLYRRANADSIYDWATAVLRLASNQASSGSCQRLRLRRFFRERRDRVRPAPFGAGRVRLSYKARLAVLRIGR